MREGSGPRPRRARFSARPLRLAGLLAFVSIAAYANSIGNGFAYDDNEIVARNPIVTEGQVLEAFAQPYWPQFAPGSGLYRPVTVATLALEYPLWSGSPQGFHAVNVLLHTAVVLGVFLLLQGFMATGASAVGAAWFALHPVHTEAVANVVGRAELLAALFVLGACLLYDRVRSARPSIRGLRLAGIALCYGLGLGSKEIAVSLPALLVVLEWLRGGDRPLGRRLLGELATALALAGVLGIYLAARYGALGTLLGETAAPSLQGLRTGERLFVALSLWPEYLRLLLLPFDLVSDYSPAVLVPSRGWDPTALAGVMILVGLLVCGLFCVRRAPAVTAGLLWFAVAISPVSQVFFTTGVVLGERTLYLPSAAVAWVGGGLALVVGKRFSVGMRRGIAVAACAFGVALLVRTVDRNPSWMSTFTMLETLAREHPESSLALRSRGTGLMRAGDVEGARRAYDAALELSPNNYAALTEIGHFYGEVRDWSRGESLLRQAQRLAPDRPHAYRLLASQYLLRGEFRAAHGYALEGLTRAGADRELYAIVSESYIAKGDFGAAERARRAGLAQDPTSGPDWRRLAEILEWGGWPDRAAEVRARAQEMAREGAPDGAREALPDLEGT